MLQKEQSRSKLYQGWNLLPHYAAEMDPPFSTPPPTDIQRDIRTWCSLWYFLQNIKIISPNFLISVLYVFVTI